MATRRGSAERRSWDLGGVGVVLRSELRLPPILTFALRRQPCAAAAAVRVVVSAGRFVPPQLDGVAIRLARPIPVRGLIGADRFWLQAGRGGVVGDLGRGRVEIIAPSARWLAAPSVLRTVVPLALALPLARHGLFLVHAAAVVDPAGRGTLLVGGGGVGKSTTTLQLLRRGWRYVGDDALLLQRRGAAIWACSFWDEPRLPLAMAPSLAPLHWHRLPPHHPDKRIVDIERSFGDVFCAAAPLWHLVWLRAPASRTRLGGARASDYLAQLVADNPLMLVCEPRAHLAVCSALVASVSRHRWRADRRLVGRVAALDARRLARDAGRR